MLHSCLERCAMRVTLAAAGCLACVGWTAAHAQVPIQDRPITRPLEPPGFLPPEQPEAFPLPPVERLAPDVEEMPRYLEVKGFAFEGNTVFSNEVLQTVAAPYAGRKVNRADLEQLRQNLTVYYVERGYINSGALLPEDFYREGIVHFHIVEGRLEEVRAKGLGRLRESYLTQRLVQGDQPLNVNTLQERFQLLLTDPMFAKINARLQPGAQPGEAILDVDVVRTRPYDLSVYVNNYLPPSIGGWAVGVDGVVRNLTGLGDTIGANFQQGEQGNRSYMIWGVMPVVYRTDIRLRYEREESVIVEEPLNVLDIGSTFQTAEIGVTHAFVDTIRRRFAMGLTYAYRQDSTTLLGEPFSFVPGEPSGTSRVNALRFEQDYLQRWDIQSFALRSTFTFGRTNVEPTALLSPFAPSQQYFAWLGQAQFTRAVLANGTTVTLRGNVQLTPDQLVPIEKVALGGVGSVRGYRENQVVRDQGYDVTLEFRYPLRLPEALQLYVIPFMDYGQAWNQGQSASRQQLWSVGLGFNLQYRGLLAELYYGRRLIQPEIQTTGNLQDDGIQFQLTYRF